MTDQTNATFMLTADGSTSTLAPTLIARCQRGRLDLYVSTREYLSDNRGVTLRLGSDAPLSQAWSPSSDKTALFYPGNAAKVEAFLNSLIGYDKLAIQVQPYSRGPKVMVFSLGGVKDVHQELTRLCPGSSNLKK